MKEGLNSDDPAVCERSRLYRQPGAYRCSREELDFLVDTAKTIPGVLGAKLTGAGLGGCVLILTYRYALDRVMEQLREKYYRKRGLPEDIFICETTDGAEFIELDAFNP
jgi:galactokinase